MMGMNYRIQNNTHFTKIEILTERSPITPGFISRVNLLTRRWHKVRAVTIYYILKHTDGFAVHVVACVGNES